MIKKSKSEIVEYLRKNLKKGYTKESLTTALINQGYSKFEVDRAFKKLDSLLASEAPILKTKPKISYEAIPINDGKENPQEKKVKLKVQSNDSTSFWKDLLGF